MRIIQEKLLSNQAGLTAYLPDSSQEMPNITARPAVLIFPGGGYAMCSDREAEPVALAYLAQGYAAFILRYTVDAKQNTFPAAFEDAKAALRQIRSHAKVYEVDPERIAVAGFSAGGHLAACLGTMSEEKPDALILGYPVILSKWGQDWGRELPGADEAVTENTPPTFLFSTQADQIVPIENSVAFCLALARAKVPFEQHIYLDGIHGSSLCTAAVSGGNKAAVNPEMAAWFPMSMRFLQKLWGDFPLFEGTGEENPGAWIDRPIPELLGNERARKIIDTLFPGFLEQMPPGLSMSLRRVAQFSKGAISEKKLEETERQLQLVMNI